MRELPEWIGSNDNTKIPDRVRVRVFGRCEGRCHRCSRKINAGERWTLEHLTALINGGANRESNLSVTCNWCVQDKNRQDVAEKSKVYRVRKRHLGLRKMSRFGCARSSPYKKKLDGRVVRR